MTGEDGARRTVGSRLQRAPGAGTCSDRGTPGCPMCRSPGSGIGPPCHSQSPNSSSRRSAMPRIRAMASPSASADAVVDRQLDGEQRALVLGDRELGERELVVPAQQAAVRLAEHVADRRRVLGPADDREGRIEDDRHPQVEPAAPVEDEVPAGDPVAIGTVGGVRPSSANQPSTSAGRTGGGRISADDMARRV